MRSGYKDSTFGKHRLDMQDLDQTLLTFRNDQLLLGPCFLSFEEEQVYVNCLSILLTLQYS